MKSVFVGTSGETSEDRVLARERRSSGTETHLECLTLVFEATLAGVDHGLRYLGPTLRGAFGHVLKRMVCVREDGRCDICRIRSNCPYACVFDGAAPMGRSIMRRYDAVPQPFVLLVAPPGSWDGREDELRFGLRLFGDACELAPYVVESFIRMGQRGIGPARVPYTVQRVLSSNGEVVFHRGRCGLHLPRGSCVHARPLPGESCTVRWHFETPVHIRTRGGLDPTPSGLDLVLAGRRRWRLMSSLHGREQDESCVHLDEDMFQTVRVGLRPWHIERFSGRQRRRIPLSGVLGTLEIHGPWHHAGSWMGVVETVHLGKYASFGFGRVRWEIVS